MITTTLIKIGYTQNITPSLVYQQTDRIIGEIRLIRKQKSVVDTPRDPGKQIKKFPLHVFTKGLEVLRKISRLQKELAMTSVEIPLIPLKKITPREVYHLTEIILEELRNIKSKFGIKKSITTPTFVKGKSPANVYENLWRASFLMDGLTSSIKPEDVYRNVQYMIAEINIIASHLGIKLTSQNIKIDSKKTPKDVLVENFVNMYMFARLERKLKMTPSYIPPLPGGKMTPANVYDTTSMILAELIRIKVNLGIDKRYKPVVIPIGKTPTDVYQQVKVFQNFLKQLLDNY